jgi:FHA domain
MAICPAGHDSASDDFCDVCGILITAAPSLAQAPAVLAPGMAGTGLASSESAGTAMQHPTGTPAPAACPQCGAPRVGQFCEACGHDFASPAPAAAAAPVPAPPAPVSPAPVSPAPVPPAPVPPAPVSSAPVTWSWTAVVTADRDYYDSVLAAGGPDVAAIAFPVYCPERSFPLNGTEVRVGRRSVARGIEPEIDLSGPPRDPGISRLHVVLIRTTDGGWAAVDPGSENGTLVNGTEIPPDSPVPLHDGDRIHLGAWTQLVIIGALVTAS